MAGVVFNEKGKAVTAVNYYVNQCIDCKHYRNSGLKLNNQDCYLCERIDKILTFAKCWVDDTVDLIHDGYTEDEVIIAVKLLFKEEGK